MNKSSQISSKPRVIKDFEKLDESIQEQIKLKYPLGFSRHLVHFTNAEGKKVSALPFEAEDKYYLVRMTILEAREIIEQDDDYDDDGILKDKIKENYEDKYSEDEEDDENMVDFADDVSFDEDIDEDED